MLTSAGVLQPIGLDSLAHTPVSLILREDEPMGSMFKVMHNHVVETSAVLPAYFASYGRREPVGLAPIPTSFLAGAPNLPHFELLHRDPAAMKTFMHAMSISHRRVPTVGMYDPAWVLDKVAADEAAGGSDRPVWVDIGGGSGHALLLFLRAYPALPADRCVVQDLPEVVEEAARTAHEEELRSVRWSAMDFHSESPVPGAMIYFLRHILRDFSDSVAVGILRNIASSMTEDSRLLISEQVTVTPPPLYSAFKDYVMMAIGGKERTMENFRDVVEAAGLSISGVFPDRGTPHAVIECARVMA